MESLRSLISQHHATGYDIRLSPRPEFFAGRGIGYGDITVKKLTALLTMIRGVLGVKAANEALLSVMALRELTATDVLLSLYEAEERNWEPAKTRGAADLTSHLASVTQKDRNAGMAAVFGILACSDRGSSDEGAICQRSEGIKLAVLEDMNLPHPTKNLREATSHMGFFETKGLDYEKFAKLLEKHFSGELAAV